MEQDDPCMPQTLDPTPSVPPRIPQRAQETVTVSPEPRRSTPKVTWQVIVVCLLMSLGSALISAYLTLERASTGPAKDLSEVAELARTLREDWRQLYQQSVDEREALKVRVKELDAQVAKLSFDIKRHQTQLDEVQASAPTYAQIKKGIDSAAKTDEGLLKEACKTLGDMGVKSLRITGSKAGHC